MAVVVYTFFHLGLLVNTLTDEDKVVVLDMFELIIKVSAVIYIIRLVLKHNLFISKLRIKVKFLGLDIEISSKEKRHPSNQK